MFDKLKVKIAAKRAARIKAHAEADKKIKKNESIETQNFMRPFRLVGRALRWIWDNLLCVLSWLWDCICSVNVVGLLNLALLVAIIVLFSILIMNISGCRKKTVIVPAPAQKNITPEYNNQLTLPIKHDGDVIIRKPVAPVQTNVQCKPVEKPKTEKPRMVYGDTIVETAAERQILQRDTVINGNLYLQNMRKYVLPCNVKINGNLFLRNVSMLQFCGKFSVSGNIYVNPTSAFGPLPHDAVLGGQVIL